MRKRKSVVPRRGERFEDLSKHKQRDLYIRLRSKIQAKKARYGDNFTSDCVLDEPGRPDLFCQYFDFYFLGADGHTIWNTILYTASEAYWNDIRDLAFDKAESLSPSKKDEDIRDWFIPIYAPSGKKTGYTMREPKKNPLLGNKTHGEFTEEYASELIRQDTGSTAPIFECFEIRKGYAYGIGLYGVVDAPCINAQVIESAIAKFRELGERDWKNDTPVPHAHLPKDTFQVLAKDVHWMPGNALANSHKYA